MDYRQIMCGFAGVAVFDYDNIDRLRRILLQSASVYSSRKPRWMKAFSATVFLLAWIIAGPALSAGTAWAQSPRTFTNPIVTSRDAPDPWMTYKDGYYYFTSTTGSSISVWKSQTITGIDRGTKVTVWTPPPAGPQSRDIWAPELHYLNNRWYVYFAADDGDNSHHRLFVLESATADAQGAYVNRGEIYDPATDRFAIDPTVLQKDDGSLFLVWSGWEGFVDKVAQNLYIAPMSNPWTLGGNRMMISRPDHSWEGWINEGPEVLKHGGAIFIIYSANGSWTPDYCLGLLMNTDGNVMNPASWTKSNFPVLTRAPRVFGPGHNTFAKSPDGSEDWIIYHATDNATDGWNNRRPRAQRFAWNSDGTPVFGYPVPPGTPLAVPAGEATGAPPPAGTGTGLSADYYDNEDFTGLKLQRTDATINFGWGLFGNSSAPDALMGPDTYSIRWSGQIQPRYSETYNFHTFSDDGIRLWLDNRLIIDDWPNHAPTVDSGSITLLGGRRYDLRVEYHQHTGEALARLEWESPSQPLEVVPATQLYPARAAARVSIDSPQDGQGFVAPANVSLNATVSGGDAPVGKVRFFQNGVLLAEAGASPYTLNWTVNAPGSYTVTATALDTSGAMIAASAPVIIGVGPPAVSLAPSVFALPARIVDPSSTGTAAPVASGALARVYAALPGVTLAQVFTARDLSGNWPASLQGITVTVGDRSAIPVAITPTAGSGIYAIDFAVPEDAAPGNAILLTVTEAAAKQAWSTQVDIRAGFPALWTVDGTTNGMAIAQNADTFLEFSSANPVPADAHTRVALYGTGIRGLAALQSLTIHARASGGDIPLMIDYAGAEGGLPGLDVVLVRLPQALAGSRLISLDFGNPTVGGVSLAVK